MAVTPSWDEYNTSATYASPTTSGITNTNWGSNDSSNLNTTTYPITAGANSFNKQQAVRFTITASETVGDFLLWASSGLSGTGDITANADTLVYKDSGGTTTSAPSATAISGSSGMPASEPGTSNIGGTATSTGEGSNVFLHQVQTNGATTAGTSITLSFKYSVTA